MYNTLMYAINPYKVIVEAHVENSDLLDDPEKIKKMVTELAAPIIEAYHHFQHTLQAQCYGVNSHFMGALLRKFPLQEYNYLHTEVLGKNQPITHHMIQIAYHDMVVGVDVAAQQFRKDKVIAEITIASSQESLFKILSERHETTTPWEVNKIHKPKQSQRMQWLREPKKDIVLEVVQLNDDNNKKCTIS